MVYGEQDQWIKADELDSPTEQLRGRKKCNKYLPFVASFAFFDLTTGWLNSSKTKVVFTTPRSEDVDDNEGAIPSVINSSSNYKNENNTLHLMIP